MLVMQNPTCDVRAYVGGQSACHHMFSLLDADQELCLKTVKDGVQLKISNLSTLIISLKKSQEGEQMIPESTLYFLILE